MSPTKNCSPSPPNCCQSLYSSKLKASKWLTDSTDPPVGLQIVAASPQHLGSESRRDLHDQIRARPQHPKNSSVCPPALARSTQSSSKENELTAEKSTEGGKWNYCIVGPTHGKRKHNVPPLFWSAGTPSTAAGNPGLAVSSGFDLGSGKGGGHLCNRAFISEAPQSCWLKCVWIDYSSCLSVPGPEQSEWASKSKQTPPKPLRPC